MAQAAAQFTHSVYYVLDKGQMGRGGWPLAGAPPGCERSVTPAPPSPRPAVRCRWASGAADVLLRGAPRSPPSRDKGRAGAVPRLAPSLAARLE